MRICLSIGAKTVEEARERWVRGASLVDVVEIRLDTLRTPDLALLFRFKPGPVLITNRRREEGGHYEGDEASRIELLVEASRWGVDYIDLELLTPPHLLKQALECIDRRQTRVILSSHNFEKTPSVKQLKALYRKMMSWQPDIVKIVTWARRYEDNLTTLSLIPYARRQQREIISFCMGNFGKPSRVMSYLMGAYLSYVSPEEGGETAPGQLKLSELNEIRRLIT
ncbi:MAG TPA: type I 3-dehydroquinate dehydratase [Syntrophales bacterium]|nr:type I 3-dehydroquinate dehydratase [Syntrophales bacterium]HOL58819.1 type I 3-dehydroquinate dehydratase [Syntrophales bacterium]HPO35146.1 type I 3-dehydroquinate dehydratase [Syntrophales bacterium]